MTLAPKKVKAVSKNLHNFRTSLFFILEKYLNFVFLIRNLFYIMNIYIMKQKVTKSQILKGNPSFWLKNIDTFTNIIGVAITSSP